MADHELSVEDAFQLALQRQKQGRPGEAESIFRSILEKVSDHAGSLHFLGIILHQRGQTDEAITLLKRSIELLPSEVTFLQNLGGLYKDCGRYEEAVPVLDEAVKLAPHNSIALSNLGHSHYRLGNDQLAVEFGQRSLEEKDRLACRNSNQQLTPSKATRSPPPFLAAEPARNVISYSLWGSDNYYRRGALINAELATYLYPEWTCRFYCDQSVPGEIVEQLVKKGAQVIQFNHRARGNVGLFWRFYVANDPNVDRFLCRDCDSWLNVKERVAVEEWIESNQCFHIMRDNIVHTELILAGMWGGVTGILPDMRSHSEAYLQKYGQRWSDQHFLRDEIWPLIRDDSLTHDSFYRLGNTRAFPRYGTMPRPRHVGCSMPRES